MPATPDYFPRMPRMLRIRDVPDDVHRRLRARAAREGLTLSDYLLREIRRAAERPTLEALRARLARRSAVNPSVSPARAVRAERGRP